MRRLSAPIACAVAFACSAAVAAQQLAPPSSIVGKPTLAAAAQPRTSSVSQQLLRGTRGNVLVQIQGNAQTASNGALADTIVRLRDARFGHIVDTQITDKTGLFSFRLTDPGSYVVELMATNQRVIGASQILNVAAGYIVSTVVRMPWPIPPLGGLLGHTLPSAAAVSSAAAASGVMATAVTNRAVSGER